MPTPKRPKTAPIAIRLTDEERAELIQAHLTECLSCLEAFDFESEIKRVFALRARVCCPEELRTRLVLLLAERDAGHDA